MTREPAPDDVTGWLLRCSGGDRQALDRLIPLVYEECRLIAARQLRHERQDHTLSPTGLVHEFYLRLVDQRRVTWQNRAHFFAVAARLMRRVLVDHARSRKAAKRGGGTTFLSLDAGADVTEASRTAEILDIDQALTRLGQIDPDQERIVELRFFAGLTTEEIAHVLERSPRTIKREWQLAKAWLFREIST